MSRRVSFEAQAMPHMQAALTLATWLVRSRTDAEDIVQDAYVRAYRGFDGFHGTEFKPWLLAIVRNRALTWLSQRKRASNVVSFEDAFHTEEGEESGMSRIPSDEPTPEQHLIADGERAAIMAALAELPPLFREVLVLREVEELSYQQIAQIADVPVGTVMSRLARARSKLRALVVAQEKREAHQ